MCIRDRQCAAFNPNDPIQNLFWWLVGDPEAFLGGRAAQEAEIAANSVRGSAAAYSIKPVNLPAWKRILIDIEHIASGHMEGGARVTEDKDLFPGYMTKADVAAAVRNAYRLGRPVYRQGSRVLVRGPAKGFDIEMWVNTDTRTIETAYPIF